MMIWISLVLLLAPLVPVQAQTEIPLSEPTTAQDPVQSATPNAIQSGSEEPEAQDLVASAAPDEEAVRAAVDALIDAQVDELLAQMGVEDKVGQLFLIHFAGNDTDILSDISVLIHAYRVGGVVLSPRHRNFTNQRGVDTPAEVASLSNQLQALAYGLLLPDAISLVDEENIPLLVETLPTLADELAEADRPPMNIPLFVGVEQMGDDFGVTSLRRGFTELPNQMTLGAAWNPELGQGRR